MEKRVLFVIVKVVAVVGFLASVLGLVCFGQGAAADADAYELVYATPSRSELDRAAERVSFAVGKNAKLLGCVGSALGLLLSVGLFALPELYGKTPTPAQG